MQIDQESVSRNHAKIINTGKSIILRDLGSTNGTYVNDELIDEYVLRDGDFIKIGRTHLQVPLAAATSRTPTTRRSTGSPPSTA